MSIPKIPDFKIDIEVDRKQIINLLLTSIVFEELGLSHIINAEGEKIQKAVYNAYSLHDILLINKSSEKMLRTIIQKQMLLQFKLNGILEIPFED